MKSKKILTVSIAAFNVEAYIKEALEPFCQDGVADKVQVFVIDDDGKDGTMKIAEEFRNRYPQTFELIHKENGGWGSTLNVAFELAEGKYFKQLDGDDYFDEKNLKTYVEMLEKIDADIVYTPYVIFDNRTNEILKQCTIENLEEGLSDLLDFQKKYNTLLTMHSLTVRTEVLRQNSIAITEHCFYTDNEFVFKTIAGASSVYVLNNVIYHYRMGQSGQSVSLESIKKHYKEFEKITSVMIAIYNSRHYLPKKELLSSYLINMIEGQYIIYFNLGMYTSAKKFDSIVKKDVPELYNKLRRKVVFCRKCNFLCIPLFAFSAEANQLLLKLGLKKRKDAFS